MTQDDKDMLHLHLRIIAGSIDGDSYISEGDLWLLGFERRPSDGTLKSRSAEWLSQFLEDLYDKANGLCQ